jgi:hypothetical protein
VNGLAVLHQEQRNYDKVEPLLIGAVEGRRLKLGDTHPHTKESLNNLIDPCEAWGKPEKAEKQRSKLARHGDAKDPNTLSGSGDVYFDKPCALYVA